MPGGPVGSKTHKLAQKTRKSNAKYKKQQRAAESVKPGGRFESKGRMGTALRNAVASGAVAA